MPNKQDKKGRYTKYSNKIGLFSNSRGGFINNDPEVVLNFPFKDTVLEAGMTKEDIGRDERFLHLEIDSKDIDTLEEPKVLEGFRYIDKNGEKKFESNSDKEIFDKNGDLMQNLLIKGNNLLALYTLREKLAGKVKLIYIDPPYNTGGSAETFTYNNDFNHSTWLTFMKNRLEVAKEFLRNDGFIAITIDHNELFYLGVLADEIFGRENLLGVVNIVIRPQGRQFSKFFSSTTEYMLVYAKDFQSAEFREVVLDENIKKEYNQKDEEGSFRYIPLMYSRFVEQKMAKAKEKYFYPIYVSKDLKDITLSQKSNYHEIWPINNKRNICWKVQKEKFRDLLIINRDRYEALEEKNGSVQIYEKFREGEGTKIKTHWIGKRYNATTSGTGVLKKILGENIFPYPKSLYAVLDTLKIMTSKDDIIMDFFAGSGTTGHATLALNKEDDGDRKFILVEQLDEHIDVCKKRLQKIISSDYENNSFVFFALKKYNQEFIDRIQSSKSKGELDEVYGDMAKNAFLKFWFDKKDFEKDEKFRSLDLEKRKELLIDILDENQLYLNYADMNDKKHNVFDTEKELTNKFYGTTEN